MAVPFSAADEAKRPLQSIPYLLSSYDGSNAAGLFGSVAAHFGERFTISPEQFMQVPVLTHETAETIPANSLVRFRGMIVDMFNPEFFLGAFKAADGTWKPAALFTDATPPDIAAAVDSQIMERRPLLLVPVPQESAWAAAAWTGHPLEPETPRPSDPRAKRTRECPAGDLAAAPAAAAAPGDEQAGKGPSKSARLASCGDAAAAADAPLTELDALPSKLQQNRDQQQAGRQQLEAAAAAAAVEDEHQQQRPQYQPGDCIVQVYSDADKFQLHDVVEVLGVLSVTPGFAALHMQQQQRPAAAAAAAGDDDAMAADDHAAAAGGGGAAMGDDGMEVDDGWWQQEHAAALPPTSQVMRLHALCIRKSAPNSSSSSPGDSNSSSLSICRAPAAGLAAQIPLLRQRVLSLLTGPLAGDELAAEYVLLTMLGSVMSRDAGGAPGLVPLSLTHVPTSSSSSRTGGAHEVVPGLAAALRCLLPRLALLPLDLATLNNTRWYPQQCAATGRLFRGRLQLAEGTMLLLDETAMAAGQLGDTGVKNLQALQQVLTQQQLPCSCQVYTQNLPVNQPAIVLSTGRSVLRDNLALQLPLQPQKPRVLIKPGSNHQTSAQSLAERWAAAEVAGPDAVAAVSASMPELAALRDYIAAARSLQCRMEQAAAEQCVARFRAQQRQDPGFSYSDLDIVVTLSKLLSVSLGHEVFSIDSWERVMQMEGQRKQRLAAALAPATALAAAADP